MNGLWGVFPRIQYSALSALNAARQMALLCSDFLDGVWSSFAGLCQQKLPLLLS